MSFTLSNDFRMKKKVDDKAKTFNNKIHSF